MPDILCPVCGERLSFLEKSAVCVNSHSFDRARSGYVNLLMSNQSGKRHGDDKLMVAARKSFLDAGYYLPLRDKLCEMAVRAASKDCIALADIGCGDGWYTAELVGRLSAAGHTVDAVGVDISRDALRYAAGRSKSITLLAASAFRLPIADSSLDMVTCVFAPMAQDEFVRILRQDGALICVTPMQRHLFELKQAVYDNAYLNPDETQCPDGFELADRATVEYTLHLRSNADITALFRMTPYYYKTGERDQNKLCAIERLDTTAQFCVSAYRKKAIKPLD